MSLIENEPGVRMASRALIRDRHDRVLLAQHMISDGTVWVGPGGAVEDGESLRDALVRELNEEANLRVKPNAQPTLVWVQRHDFEFGEWATIQNHYFLLRADDFESMPATQATDFPFDPGLLSMRWWSQAELVQAANDPTVLFSPRAFPTLWAELLRAARHRQLPSEPSRLGE